MKTENLLLLKIENQMFKQQCLNRGAIKNIAELKSVKRNIKNK